MAAAYQCKPLDLPGNMKVLWLSTLDLVESIFSSLMAPLHLDSTKYLTASIDAEWNISRTSGVSICQIAPHSDINMIYVIPVSASALSQIS